MASTEGTRLPWSTRKRDAAPRGVFRHPSGTWAIRYTCGAGHIHKERIGPIKTDAVHEYYARRSRAQREPGWCPRAETEQARAQAQAAAARERARIRFREFVAVYRVWRQANRERSWRGDSQRLKALSAHFGNGWLDEITARDVDSYLVGLIGAGRAKATANRYRAMLSALFKHAMRDGHVTGNPVREVPQFKENNQRMAYLTDAEEHALHDALPPVYRPHFTVSLHTGLRWSEQMGLTWRDVDLMTGFVTVPRSKHGEARRVPVNSTVRTVLVDLATRRQRPHDPRESVFAPRPTQAFFFPGAVERARAALADAKQDTTRLDGYVWHSNRHTFASRLAMAGVDLLTLKELGGWKTLSMVQRYAHLRPGHLQAAVERLVSTSLGSPAPALNRSGTSPQLARASQGALVVRAK